MNTNLLTKISRSKIRLDPFPHYIIEDALPNDIYSRLDESFPDLSTIFRESPHHIRNDREHHTFRLLSKNFNEKIIGFEEWSKFINTSLSRDFFDAIVNYFLADEIDRFYPGLRGKLRSFKHKTRSGDLSADRSKVLSDFQLVANMPFRDNHSSRSPHLDNPQQIYALLYYMRSKNDRSIGGGLNLYSAKKSAATTTHGRHRSIDPSCLTAEYILPYRPNTAILFLNTRISYHSVQPIFNQEFMRRSVNIIGELPPGSALFQIP